MKDGIWAAVLASCGTGGEAWAFAHAYEGQPFLEGLAPIALSWVAGLILAGAVWRALRYL